ncbi:MAG: type II toxin-antitoxin system VapC family toxin [Anaerolineae bacterium]|nr:type II toxin-antitoxin system VapC family toxin [Anaerolineae bacterium]
MIRAVADTHTVIWYLANDARLSFVARQSMEAIDRADDQIGLSSISFVEMVYLIEKGRIPAQRFTELATALAAPYSLLVELPVDLQVARALARVDVQQIPDMPDRIIAATALHLNVPVISRDGKIRLSGLTTIW